MLTPALLVLVLLSRPAHQAPAQDPVRVPATEPGVVPITVVDHDGKPRAGVPVVLAIWDDHPRAAIDVGTTGSDGVVMVRRLAEEVGCHGRRDHPKRAWGVAARLYGCAMQRVADPPGAPLRIVLPAGGPLVVEATDAQGVLLRQQLHVWGRFPDHEDEKPWNPVVGLEAASGLDRARVTVPWVRANLSFRLAAGSGSACLEERTVRSATRPGETTTVKWVMPPTAPTLEGVLTVAGGAPWPLGVARLRAFGSTRGMGEPCLFMTDDRGRFAVNLGHDWKECRDLRLTLDALDAGGQCTGRRAKLVFENGLVGGRHDLGRVELTEPPRIADCMVVDAAGKPVSEPQLEVFELREARPGEAASFESRELEDQVQAFPSRDRIHLFGQLRPGRFFLRATGGRPGDVGASEFVPVVAGMRPSFVVWRYGHIQVEAKLGPILPGQSRFVATLSRGTEMIPHARRELHSLSRSGMGGCHWNHLLPGRYTLRIATAIGDHLLAQLDDLIVESGQVCADPRLRAIDVTGATRTVRLRVLMPPGMPPANDAAYHVFTLDPRQQVLRGDLLAEHPIEFQVGRRQVEVLIRVRDCRIARWSGAQDEDTVRLEPAPIVPLKLTFPGLAMPAGARASMHLALLDPPELEAFISVGPHVPGETVEARPPQPGRYQARVLLELASRREDLQLEVIVPDGKQSEALELALPAEATRAALAKLVAR